MKKLTFILAGLICMLATSCMFSPLSADVTIKNETPASLILNVDYNQKTSQEIIIMIPGASIKKSLTGNLTKADLKNSSGGLHLTWMTTTEFDAKKQVTSKDDNPFWRDASDYIILTERYQVWNEKKRKWDTYPAGETAKVEKVTDSYSITFSGSDESSITCEVKAN